MTLPVWSAMISCGGKLFSDKAWTNSCGWRTARRGSPCSAPRRIPCRCHRHHLLARELELERAIQVWHIRVDGTLNRAVGFAEDTPQAVEPVLKIF